MLTPKKLHPYIDLSELLAAPLTALIDADAYAAESFAEFIRKYGFESSKGENFGKLRMVTFSYNKPGPDGNPRTYQASIALLALLPLPTLTIRDADVRFNVDVLGAVQPPSASTSQVRASVAPAGTPGRPHRLLARIARTATARSQAEEDEVGEVGLPEAHMKVRLHVVQGDLPEGVAQFLRMMNSSTTESPQVKPSLTLQAVDGKTAFTGVGDVIKLQLLVTGAAGTPQPNAQVSFLQDTSQYLTLPTSPVQTDTTGNVWVNVPLAQAAPAGTGRVFKTVSATAAVPSQDGGSYDVTGSLVLEVPRLPT